MSTTSKKILIFCLGKSDPYTFKGEVCRTGPTLSLILNYMPSHMIVFVSKDIEEENRLLITERTIHELYQAKNQHEPIIDIIRISTEAETYNYQEVFKRVCNELRTRLSKFDRADEYFFSKTAGTTQFKIALELFPHLFLKGYQVHVPSKDNDRGKDPIKLEPEQFDTKTILSDICDEGFDFKEDIKKTIHANSDELNIQAVFAKLQIFRELIHTHEYSSAKSLLEALFPYLLQDRKAVIRSHWLNEIYPHQEIRNIYKVIKFCGRLLAFELPSDKETHPLENKLRFIERFFVKYRDSITTVQVEIAYQNFQIYQQKKLKKEMALSFSVLLERLRKNSVIESMQQLAKPLFQLNENESIKDGLSTGYFYDYYCNFIEGGKSIELSSESKSLNGDPIRSLTLPVVEVLANYLYEQHGINNEAYEFYQQIKSSDANKRSYKRLKDLRNKLAHDFVRITDGDSILIEDLHDILTKVWQLDQSYNIYSEVNDYIINIMFALKTK